jgi:hypothetical protein
MEITQGPKQARPLTNFFDDEMTTTGRELLFDGKRYSELDSDEQRRAMAAAAKRAKGRRQGWAFLGGLFGICAFPGITIIGAAIVLAIATLVYITA